MLYQKRFCNKLSPQVSQQVYHPRILPIVNVNAYQRTKCLLGDDKAYQAVVFLKYANSKSSDDFPMAFCFHSLSKSFSQRQFDVFLELEELVNQTSQKRLIKNSLTVFLFLTFYQIGQLLIFRISYYLLVKGNLIYFSDYSVQNCKNFCNILLICKNNQIFVTSM